MPEGFDFFFVIFDFAAFFFNCNAALFQIGNNVFKADVLFVDLLLGGFDDFIGKTELFGNCKGVTFSGNADQQPVGRAQRFHIEFTAGVFNKFRRKGVDFQLAVMCGRHCADAAVMQIVQDCDRQRCTLSRVGPGPQLIEQAQGICVCLCQNGDDGGHVGGKGTQALFNALFVTDICENLCKNGQLRAVQGRNVQTCLPHQREQSDCF